MRNQINTNPQNWIKDWFNKTPCTLIMTFFSRGNNIRLTCKKQFKIEPWVSKIRMLRNLKIDEMFKDFEFILLSISFFILNVIFAQNISGDHSHHVRKIFNEASASRCLLSEIDRTWGAESLTTILVQEHTCLCTNVHFVINQWRHLLIYVLELSKHR